MTKRGFVICCIPPGGRGVEDWCAHIFALDDETDAKNLGVDDTIDDKTDDKTDDKNLVKVPYGGKLGTSLHSVGSRRDLSGYGGFCRADRLSECDRQKFSCSTEIRVVSYTHGRLKS